MATPPAPTKACKGSWNVLSDSIETLSKQVECPICMEIYKDPKALPCLHTYCKECLQQLVHHRTKDQTVTCPQCRSLVRVEGNNVDNLPTVFFINQIIEFCEVLKKAESNDVACQNCSSGRAVAFCQTCPPNGMFVCGDCDSAHKKMKIFEGHKVIPISHLRQGSLLHLPAREPPLFSCEKHDGELQKLYCYECRVLICRDCTLVDHSQHKFDFVKSVSSVFRKDVQTNLGPLNEILQNVMTAIERVKTAKDEVTKHGERSAESINRSYDQLVAVIEEQRGALLEENKKIVDKKLGVLETQQDELQLAQATINSVLSFVEKSTANACDEEFLSMKENISNRVDEVGDSFKNIELDPKEIADVGVVVSPSTQQLKEFCENFCLVKASLQETTKASTKQLAKSTVTVTDMQAQPCSVKVAVEASLKSLVDGSITICDVVQTTPSTYEVSYTPQIRGRHQLSVSVNNHEITTKQMFVHHPPTQLGTPVRVISGVTEPWGITNTDFDELYVAGDFRISKYNTNGHRMFSVGELGSEPFGAIQPRGVAVGRDGSIYATNDYILLKLNKEGDVIKSIGGSKAGASPGEFDIARCVKVHNDKLYVCDWKNHRIQVFDLDLNFLTMFGTKGDHKLKSFIDIDFDSQGNMYITDVRQDQIAVYDCEMRFVRIFASKSTGTLSAPWGVCVSDGYVYVTEHHNHCVSVFLLSGQFVCSFGKEGRSLGQLMYPHGISIDKDGFCFVADEDNNRIQMF